MIQLVNDILQLSSLDNASETSSMPEMEVVDLLDVAKECVERQKLNARHAYITLTYLGESAPVRGNRNLLDELCQNLCDNAIRYNRPGGKVQIVTACTRDGHCSLTVTDNGIGIPRESQSSVFERFYRVDKSRSKATGGTGLGLAIVKHIALIHRARITLKVRWPSARPSRSPSPRHPDFSSTQKYNVCLQLRAGVFCWVKPVGRACAQQTVLLQMQQVCPLLFPAVFI